jgi:peptide/nickel transport system substrate-binding protein
MMRYEPMIRHWAAQVRGGGMSRRRFLRQLSAYGIGAPLAGAILAQHGVAQAQARMPAYAPTRRGGGGPLRMLWWQGPVHLNPHMPGGLKEQEGSRIFYEPLAAWDNDGNLLPVLAEEIPTRENGGLAADLTSVTWKLKPGVTWHDEHPFTADDVVFTWEYASDPATAAFTSGAYRDIRVDKLDAHTVRITFPQPRPFWAEPFTGPRGLVIPRHVFSRYAGARAREAPANVKPVGTGCYRFSEFRPGDLVRGEAYPRYHIANRPWFDTIEMKGGGDAVGAARAVLQTGEYDYAWSLQVEDEILKRLEAAGKGRVTAVETGAPEFIMLQAADPWTEVDGERASPRSRHPAFSDKAVREAMGLLLDRRSIQEFIYGSSATATPNFLNNPARYRSANMKSQFDIGLANRLLDSALWRRGGDGIRSRDGVRLKFVFQTTVSQLRQKTQAVLKDACSKAGIDLELKAVTPSVFFGSDEANPDTFTKFWADMQMYAMPRGAPDPLAFMGQFTSSEIASKANRWSGRNVARWRNDEYDRTHEAARGELDPVRRAALFMRLNDLVCGDGYVLPILTRLRQQAVANRMVVHMSAWDNDLWALAHWHTQPR